MLLTWYQSADPQILLWLALLIVFLVVELITVGLASIWFAAGALVALLVAALGGSIGLQIVVFLVVSVILLAATRPFAKRVINARMQKTNVDALIGKEIIIRESVNNMEQTGTAFVEGKEWTVRAADEHVLLQEGATAKIVDIRGVKLIVEPL